MDEIGHVTTLPADETIRQLAKAILESPDYQTNSVDYSLLDRFFNLLIWLFRPLKNFFDGLAAISPVLAWLIIIGLVLLLLLLIWHICYTFTQAIKRRFTEPTGLPRTAVVKETAIMWEEKAASAVSLGEHTLALRCLLKASFIQLENTQKRPFRRGITNRECLRLFRNTGVCEPLQNLVDMVDMKWYGNMTCSAADYCLATDSYNELSLAASELSHA